MEMALLHKTYPARQTPTNRPYPANQAQVYRAILHQRAPLPDQPQMDFTLIHQTDLLLIDPDGDCPITQDILWADQTPETDPT